MKGIRRARFTSSPYDREILRLGAPALGALAAEPLYLLVDTAIVGRLGTIPLAGLGVASTLLATGFVIFNFLAYGTTAAVARARGAGARTDAVRAGVSAMWLGAGIGAVLALIGYALARPAVAMLGARGDVAVNAQTYLSISALGAPAVLIALAGMGYLRGVRDTRSPLVIALIANAANLVIELWLVFGLDMGIAGSAWATVIAQTGAAVVFVWLMVRAARAAGEPFRAHRAAVRASVRVGIHLIVRTGSLLVSFAVVAGVATRINAAAVAAHQVAFQVWIFLALVLDAIAIAAQAMVGTYLGAGAADEARAAARRMIGWGVVVGMLFLAIIAASRGAIASAFIEDPAVRAAISDVLLIVAAMQPLNAVVFVLDGVLIGAGDVRFLAIAMASAGAVVLIPGALAVLAVGGTLSWLWLALGAFMVARLVGVGIRFASGSWMRTGAVISYYSK